MTPSEDKITEIFYLVDDFCIQFDQSVKKTPYCNEPGRKPEMSCFFWLQTSYYHE